MSVKIALRLSGLDLRAVESYLRIPEELGELGFEAKGPISLAVVHSDSSTPAFEAAEWARKIAKLMPGVHVVGVHEELVSISDIALRCGVAPEAVRLWATGKRRTKPRPFPAPRDTVGQGERGRTLAVYCWAEVASWVREALSIDPDDGVDYLSPRQIADLNVELAHLDAEWPHVHDGGWAGWQELPAGGAEVTAETWELSTSSTVGGPGTTRFLDQTEDVLSDNERSSASARRLLRQ